ncbi:MAG: EAL domain-containing protein [Sulfurospirillaceae bacterium]|nr:EAL domain-containing protein [Sulfurospirillaceae bacterium]
MVSKLLETGKICIHFQPIISIRNAKVIGVEALMRAYDENGESFSPIFVFEQAKKEGVAFEFDKYVRKKALEAFVPLYQDNHDLFLFLNFESYLLDTQTDFEVFEFSTISDELGIPPSRIVLEIKENQIKNTHNLKLFCEYFKQRNFLIALDDFGAGNANFDRIATVRPNIVKIDRSIVFNVHQNFINKEILKSITNMCFNIGALVLAEGVECEEEILKSLNIDIDLFQGFWFAKPQAQLEQKMILIEKIEHIGQKHTLNIKIKMQTKEELITNAKQYANRIIEAVIAGNTCEDLFLFLDHFNAIEAIYCIDAKMGIQEGNTVINTDVQEFFRPAQSGDSHALKEYFYITKESKRGNYLSQKYISRASGKMCRTFAQKFDANGREKIMCLDLKVNP